MAETEVVKIINIKTNAAVESVKDLKNYINDLRDDLVKVEKGSKEYEQTLEEIANAQTKLTEVTRDSKNAMNYAEGSYKALNQELVNLRNEYRNLSAEQRNSAEVGGAMLQRISELDRELKDIDATLGNFQRNVGDYRNAILETTEAYKSQKSELRELKVALEQLEPGTAEYNQAFARAAEITHNLAYQQEMLKYSSADLGDQLSNIRGIASNMAAGFSAVNAAMGLFGEKNDDVAKALLKVQQCMALVQGLQGLDGLLKRTKGLTNAMKVWVSTSKQVTTATNAETVAVKGLNAAIKANPIGAILTAVLALAAGIKPLINLIEKLSGKFKGLDSAVSASTAGMKELDEAISKIDRENNLEVKLMQASGLSEIAIIAKQLEGAESKLTEQTSRYNEQITLLTASLKEYGKNKQITTGTLKEFGLTQEQITELVKDGNIQIKESDKVLKRFTKNDGFKIMLENVLDVQNGLKGINQEINDLKDETKVATVKASVDAAKEAAKKREQIENDYINRIQKKYGTSIRETVNNYKEELKTLQDFLTLQLKVQSGDTKNQINKIISEIKVALKDANAIDIFSIEAGGGQLKKNFESLKKIFQANMNDIIRFSSEETQRKINDEIIRLFEKTIEPKLSDELQRIQNEIDKFNSKINIDIFRYGGKDNELEKARVNFEKQKEMLEASLTHYNKIIDEVEKNDDLIPSDVYDDALQKRIEINNQIEQLNIKRWEDEQAINKKYFQIELAAAETQAQELIDTVNEKFVKNQSTSWLQELLGFADSNAIQQEKEYVNELYLTQKEGLEKVRDLWEQRKNEEDLSYDDRLEAEQNFQQAIKNLQLLDIDFEAQVFEQKKELVRAWVDEMKEAVSTIGQLFGSVADYRKDDIDNQFKNKEISQEQAEAQYEKNVKPLMVAEATVNMLQGMVSAFAGAMQLGPIAGPIVGGALAAMVYAMGKMNIEKIRKTKYNSTGGSGSASVPAPSTDYDFKPIYVSNTTGQEDTENLRNALVESPIRAYVVEADITDAQNRTAKRNNEGSF